MALATHRQLDLAVEQLQIALDLFLDGTSHVSSLTLAGAAEEILGKEADLSGKGNLLREELEMANHLAKHLNDQKTLAADLEEAACWMLVRALANRRLLELPELSREREFDDWFYENVVGV